MSRFGLSGGTHDPIGDHEYAGELASALRNVDVCVIAGADHTLPAARPQLIIELADSRARARAAS
ncbi:hypothetical protein BH20ACT2_BH20ACT2_24760 [soil metagenome]